MAMVKVFVAVTLMLILKFVPALPASWPPGTYSLPKPKSGCPKFWKQGWLKQDVEDDRQSYKRTEFSPNFHMNATLIMRSGSPTFPEFVRRMFCTKVNSTSGKIINTDFWPKGYYCIYKKHTCPRSMVEGSIYWDDEDNNNANNKSGYLPDLDFNKKGTKLYYCCQNEGKWYEPIELPTEKPFYLLPHGSRNCQRVKFAVSQLEYIIYDTENSLNSDEFYGHHVFTDQVKSLPEIYYCYYKSCQHEMRNNMGSLRLNNSYSDFQQCSWSINLNTSSRIFIKFQSLTIPNCKENSLDIYDGDSESILLARYCGENATSGTSVTLTRRNLYITLKSGNNSAGSQNPRSSRRHMGFSLEYEASPYEPSTSPTTRVTRFTTNSTFNSGTNFKKDLKNDPNENTTKYLSIILPTLGILILLGTVAAIFYWKRRTRLNKENHASSKKDQMKRNRNLPNERSLTQNGHFINSTASTNPIYESEVDRVYENESIAMHRQKDDTTYYESIDTKDNARQYGVTEITKATDNILYEPGNEILEGNPIYEMDEDVDVTYSEPIN